MRLFVSSSFEAGFLESLKAASDYARDAAPKGAVKWVEPENFHLTYAFLGEVGPEAAASARKGLDAALKGQKAFTVSQGGFGFFPSSRRARVIWVGIGEGAERLRELAGRLAESLSAAGLFFENRFEPHVTLGRVKDPLPDSFARRLAGYAPARRASSLLGSVELMESVLTPDGPVYRQVCSRRLV